MDAYYTCFEVSFSYHNGWFGAMAPLVYVLSVAECAHHALSLLLDLCLTYT